MKTYGTFHFYSVLPPPWMSILGRQLVGIRFQRDRQKWCREFFFRQKTEVAEICSSIGGNTSKNGRDVPIQTNWYKQCKNKNKLTSFMQSWTMEFTSYSFSRLIPYLGQNNRTFLYFTFGKFCRRISLTCLYVFIVFNEIPFSQFKQNKWR